LADNRCYRRLCYKNGPFVGSGPYAPEENEAANDRQAGLYRRRQRRKGHAGQPRILGLQSRIDGAWPLWIVGVFGGDFGQEKVADRGVEGAMRADRTDPVDEFRTIRRHDHVAGVKIAVTQPAARRQAVDQGEVCRGILSPAPRIEWSSQSRKESTAAGGDVP
jgi:hypothetical protein